MKDQTLDFYNENASEFVADTFYADMSKTADRFLRLLPKGAAILDLGCGSGRDSLYFLERGYKVTAVDGSEELCRLASENTGLKVRHMYFSELEDRDMYEGVWASASILHVPRPELPDVMTRIWRALREGGILFCSFKYGNGELNRGPRHYTDMTEESFAELLKKLPAFRLIEQWQMTDVRPGREQEYWLDVLLQKEGIHGSV